MSKILVTGASGHLGQAVIRHLLESYSVPAANIVAASRDTAKLSDLAAKGVETRAADFDDSASLEKAFTGIDTLLIISTDALAVPGQRLKQHQAAVAATQKAGVKHIAYTSMPNPDKSLVTFAPDHLGTEEAVKASGLPYTILRNAWYLDNYIHAMPHNLETGTWYTATADGKVSNISRDATVKVSADDLRKGIESAGMPGFVAAMLASANANIAAGNFEILTNDYETLTGKKPQTSAEFFEENKAALIG